MIIIPQLPIQLNQANHITSTRGIAAEMRWKDRIMPDISKNMSLIVALDRI
jgi:hypothetical protein